MSQPKSFECPNCATSLMAGTQVCGICRMRLTGADAARLWQVDQQIGVLTVERRHLIGALTKTVTEAATSGGMPTAADPYATPYPAPAPRPPKKSMSGQQLLLGLGALMLLSAASFFLLVIWFVVGLIGQALIMATLTGAAVAGSVWATRRALPAAAETAAVIATGLLLIDLSAAHALGLAGLGSVPDDRYWAGAGVLAAALLLGWDRLVPRHRDGTALRRVLTYRPAAALMVASVPWSLLAVVEPGRAWLPAALGLVALINLVCGAVALKVDEPATGAVHHRPEDFPTPKRRYPVSAVVLFVSAAVGFTAHIMTGLGVGYDLTLPASDRYAAFALLMLFPVTLTVLSTRVGARSSTRLDASRVRFPAIAALWAAPVLGIPLTDATYPVLVALAGLAAITATCVHLGLIKATTAVRAAWLQVLSMSVFLAQPVLYLGVLVVLAEGHPSVRSMVVFDHLPDPVTNPSVLWMVTPAALWAASSVVGAVVRRSSKWLLIAHIATLTALVTALWDTSAHTWMTVLLTAFVANVALACVAVRRGSFALVAPANTPNHGDVFWAGVDRLSILFGTVYAFAAVISTLFGMSAGYLSFVLVTVGVLVLAYAANPTRLPFAYLGSLAISAGTANLMREASVEMTEAYTAPLVVLLAGIGFVQWSRNKSLPTFVTMGPALSVLMGPSLLAAITSGDSGRLAFVTVAGIIALLVGLSQRWKAPVTAGGLVLIVVAVTQGGPLTAYVPGWVILGAGGAALLTAGLAWEQAVTSGRRANAWFHTLR